MAHNAETSSLQSNKLSRIRPKLTAAQLNARQDKMRRLSAAVDQARHDFGKQVASIAENHHRSENYIKQHLFITGSTQTRTVNPWNGYVRETLATINTNRSEGEKLSFPQFLISEEGQHLKREWSAKTEEEKKAYSINIESFRADKYSTIRADPRTVARCVQTSFDKIEKEWISTETKTGGEGFYIYVRKELNQVHTPKVHYTPLAEKFLKDVLNIEPEELALKLESYLIGNQGNVSKSCTRVTLISQCRQIIQSGLNEITKKEQIGDKIQMNYENYEAAIVERHALALDGWTEGRVRNPGSLGGGCTTLNRLLAALRTGSCRWVKLTKEDLSARMAANREADARGEPVYKKRKKSAAKSSAVISDSDEDIQDGS